MLEPAQKLKRLGTQGRSQLAAQVLHASRGRFRGAAL